MGTQISAASASPATKLGWSLALAKRGFRVFPIHGYDPDTTYEKGPIAFAKKAAIEQWQFRATDNPEQIRKWWTENPDYNIGILTNQLLVLDIDIAKGGDVSFAALDLLGPLPRTFAVKTQSGGTHLYFSLPPHTEVRNSVSKIGQGLDVRGSHGYVVAPGSTVEDRLTRFL
jgi:Bifunctional DNA primase/polymerase, N-terminal